MRQAYRFLPVYAGDVSGVCSALFELGGMVVIHDPSGCNSTYNTHDETRWYDQDSLIFISGLTDVDAMLGNDERLVDDVVEAVEQTRPRFVCLCSSPVPYQVGCDLEAIAQAVEHRTGVPSFAVQTNGMHDYVRGAGLALDALARRMPLAAAGGAGACSKAGKALGSVEPNESAEHSELGEADIRREATKLGEAGACCEHGGLSESVEKKHGASSPTFGSRRPRVNVLGMTPLDFAAPGSRDSLAAWLDDQGFELASCWAMGSSLDELECSASADLDLVVSAVGIRVARTLQERCGIPWVAGVPVGAFGHLLAQAMSFSAADGKSRVAYRGIEQAQAFTSNSDSRGFPQGHASPGELANPAAPPNPAGLASQLLKGSGSPRWPAEGSLASSSGLISLVGEPVQMASLAAALRLAGQTTKVVCPLEDCKDLLGPGDVAVRGEEQIEQALKDASLVIADPFYRELAPATARFCRMPHLALSGRQWLHEVPNLFRLDPLALMATASSLAAPRGASISNSEEYAV